MQMSSSSFIGHVTAATNLHVKKRHYNAKDESEFRFIPSSRNNYHIGYMNTNRNGEKCILISDKESMHILHYEGCFGKYATKEVTVLKTDKLETIVTMQPMEVIKDNSEQREENLDSDSDSDSRTFADQKTPMYVLSLEEALYLLHAFGCIQIVSSVTNEIFHPRTFFNYCLQQSINGKKFILLYAAYHYYRCKGWVVKSGANYGVDYVLYKSHPRLYHSTYGILVLEPEHSASSTISWRYLAGLSRILKSVKKSLVLCQLICSRNFYETYYSTPDCIRNFTIKEIHVDQWFLGKHFRENDHV